MEMDINTFLKIAQTVGAQYWTDFHHHFNTTKFFCITENSSFHTKYSDNDFPFYHPVPYPLHFPINPNPHPFFLSLKKWNQTSQIMIIIIIT